MFYNGTQISSVNVNGIVEIDEKLSATSPNPIQTAAVANNVANALKATLSGSFVTAKDISPIEHIVKVRATSPESLTKLVKSGEAVTLTSSPNDGTMNITNYTALNDLGDFNINSCGAYVYTSLDNLYYHVYPFSGESTGLLLSNGDQNYVIRTTGQSGGDVYCYITDDTRVILDIGNGLEEYQVAEGTKIQMICCYGEDFADKDQNSTQNVEIYGCELQAGMSVKVCGKNLFDVSKVISGSWITNNGDGSITVKTPSNLPSSSAAAPNTLRDYAPTLKVGETYVFSAVSDGITQAIYLQTAKVTWWFNKTLTITDEMLNSPVYWYAKGNNTTATISNIQIEKGTTATEYEPYKEPVTCIINGETSIISTEVYPSVTFISDTDDELSVEYNRDIVKAFSELQQLVSSLSL